MEEKMTVEQLLGVTVNLLNGINIPAGLIEQIGIPVSRAINYLQLCIDAMRKKPEEADEET